ncbi:TetR family transcriptional regulator [Mycolicibacter heraklionensis]|uniref:TetR/AcrR family transcriptional regulator n=1 Tax=Mycolicibacter heraklionensis TaxID=512402 RepID=UPI00061AAD41|nr:MULTISPECIES: TetR family transcriptional regulator [Mycobacteriaceae]OBJ29933.1 TetR family transcriptional regulator [Mycolicibacter heraklionensis]
MATASNSRKPGRPSGASDNRDKILTAARDLFARNGFANTSIRAVAAAAGVDAALVHHYHGTKQQLFAAAVELPIDPMTVLGPLRETPVEELGRALPELLLPLWDSQAGTGLIAALRSMLTGTEVPLARSFFRDIVIAELAPRIDEPSGTGVLRAEFAASQLMGVVVARYIIGLEPIASLPAQQVVAMIAPTLQRYLTGDLPDPLGQ